MCTEKAIRIVEGVTQYDTIGPIEVCIDNQWVRVNDHYWSEEDATAACNQLFGFDISKCGHLESPQCKVWVGIPNNLLPMVDQ